MPATGQHFNLKQDWWRDERRDPIASTNAALDYLEKLFEMQGDWYLALASYNWGEGSVQRAMAKNEAAGQPTDYLSLSMPDETRNYVPKLQAIKNIIADPQRYAVALPPVGNTPYFVTVRKNSDIDLEIAAKLAEMPLDEFKALNPSFNRPVIRGDHAPTLLLPADRVEIFNANLTNYKGDLSAWKVYHSRRGESYASIAKRFGVSEAKLRETNDIGSRQKVAAGQSMLVPGDPAPAASRWPRWPRRRRAGFRAGQQQGRAMAARRRRLRPASPAPAPTSAPIRSGRATPCSRWPSSTAPRSTLRALNNLKGNALKVGGQRVPGTNARGRGPRALRASPGRRSGPAAAPRGPGLARPRFGVAGVRRATKMAAFGRTKSKD